MHNAVCAVSSTPPSHDQPIKCVSVYAVVKKKWSMPF